MNLLQFSVVLFILFLIPIIPAVVTAFRCKILTKTADAERKPKLSGYLIAVVSGLFVVLAASLYLIYVAPFNGQIDIDKTFGPVAKDYAYAWDMARYGVGAVGAVIGIVFLVSTNQIRQTNPAATKLHLAFGVFCLLYGAASPYIMSAVAGLIRDSHLM